MRVGSVAGVDVRLTTSWFVIVALVAFLAGPLVEQAQPGLGGLAYVAAVAFALLLALSLLAHEAAHAVVALRCGFRVSGITLHFLGGFTEIEGESERPRQELLIALAGPVASLAVGGLAIALHAILPSGLVRLTVDGIAAANVLVGVINLVPGIPLDGGRVLKAVVWSVTGDPHRGTLVAGWSGRVVALLFLGWPLLVARVFGGPLSIFDLVMAGFISMFLWSASSTAIQVARVRSRLPDLAARDLARRTLAVPGDLPLAEAVRRAQEAEAGSIVTLTSGGVPDGVVSEQALLAVPADRRPWLPISSVARTLDDGLRLPAALRGEDLIRAISARPASEYLLVDPDGVIVGVLAASDVDRAVSARS